jgi:hypothetical protein
MNKNGWESRKGDSVGQGLRRAEEDGRVCCVLDRVEDTVCNNVSSNVNRASVVECGVSRNREVGRVPGVGDCGLGSEEIQGASKVPYNR